MGGVEIDENVAKIYCDNHHPKYLYNMDLREFNKKQDLPAELYQLDLLDGSPPCSTFSMAGSREDAWGKEKQFAEGQALQTLDDLVFIYCDTILKLMPKCFLLENVKGLTAGNAKSYVKRVVNKLQEGGYVCQVFVQNAALMGVPQARERAFIIGHKKEYGHLPKLVLNFNEEPILFKHCQENGVIERDITDMEYEIWQNKIRADAKMSYTRIRMDGKNIGFTRNWIRSWKVCPTLTTADQIVFDFPRYMTERELKLVSSFPLDYKAPNRKKLLWLCGMSVPPVMTANIANEIYNQWLSKIKK